MKRGTKALILLTSLAAFIFLYGRYNGRHDPSSSFKVSDISSQIKFSGARDFSVAFMVNLDDDEEKEIYVGGYNTSNLLLKRRGDELQPLLIPELEDTAGFTFAAVACDIDQDGRDEIFVLNRTEKAGTSIPKLMKYEKGIWKNLLAGETELSSQLRSGKTVTCIDRKGDGLYGLAVVSSNGPLFYLEKSNGKIKDISTEIGLQGNSVGGSIIGIPGPLGFTNIFVGNKAENFYFENDGEGRFHEIAKVVGVTDPTFEARGATVFDANHDEVPDLVYGNHLGPLRLFRQNRSGTFTDVTPDQMKSSYAVNAAAAADFNLDGYEDLYLNNMNSANVLFARHEDQWFRIDQPLLEEAEMSGISTLVGDLDGKPGIEILNTHGSGKEFPLKLYSIKPAGNWIAFTVHYANGGLPRGASVKARSNQRDFLRTIGTGAGRYANYTDEMYFGLRKKETILSVEVIMPSGRTEEFRGPFHDQSINSLKVIKTQWAMEAKPQNTK